MRRSTRYSRPGLSGSSKSATLLGADGDGSTLTLDFTTGQLDPRLTFTRASLGTYIGNDGSLYGADTSTSSQTISNSGTKTFTLAATAGVNRRYAVGDTVIASSGVNNMSGTVTSYDPTTQVLVFTATSSSGSGTLATWSIGTRMARFDHDPTTLALKGLLIEATATNRALRSNDFNTTVTDGTQWIVSGYTRGNVSTTLPDGTTGNACRISGTGSASFRTPSIAVTASTAYTFSFWARNNGGSQARYRVWNATAGSSIVDYTLPGSNYVSQIGGANNTSTTWVRVFVPFTTPVGCTSIFVYPTSSDTGTVDLLLWGAQVEEGSFPSSYIPTVASTVTRNADTAIIAAGANFTSWYQGGTQGTFYADWFGGERQGASGSTNRTVLSTDDVSTKHLHMLQTAAAGNLRVADFGGTNNVTTANTLTSGARTKGAFSYNGGTANVCLNGGAVATGSSLAFSNTPTWLVIGGTSTNGTSITDANVLLNNSVRVIKYWPYPLPNATLQGLTT